MTARRRLIGAGLGALVVAAFAAAGWLWWHYGLAVVLAAPSWLCVPI